MFFPGGGRQQCRLLIQNFLEPARSLFSLLNNFGSCCLLEFTLRQEKQAVDR